MKKALLTLLVLVTVLTLCFAFAACNNDDGAVVEEPEVIPEGVTLATEHGVKAGDMSAAVANTEALNALFYSAADGDTIYIPRGTYYLKTAYNSNVGEQGLLYIRDKKNLTVMGSGALLINAQFSTKISTENASDNDARFANISGCENLKLQGLRFDYLNYVMSCGTIISAEFGTMSIKLDSRFLDSTREKPVVDGTEYIGSVNVLDEDGASVSEYYAVNVDDGITYTLQGDVVTLEDEFVDELKNCIPGRNVVLRFTSSKIKLGTAFVVENTQGFSVKDLDIYSTANAAFYIPAGSSSVTFDNLNVAPKEGDPQLWGSTVDAIHIKGLRNFLTIKNSTFVGIGDDALNIHSRAGIVHDFDAAAKTFRIYDGYHYTHQTNVNQNEVDAFWGQVGDTVEFFNNEFHSYGTATITAKGSGEYTFDAIPEGVGNGTILENRAYLPTVLIENTVVDGGRARAFLVQSENITIRNCTIKNMGLPGIIISPDLNQWYEAGPSDNVLIENNTFYNVCSRAADGCYGAVVVKACHDGGGDNYAAGVHTNMTIRNNTFEKIGSSAVYVSATAGVTVENNTVRDYSRINYYGMPSSKKAYAFVNCTDLTLSGNGDETSLYEVNVTRKAN